MDCGSFTQEVIETVENNCLRFYIRAQKCADLTTQIKQITTWEKVQIGDKMVEIASIEYKPFKKEKSYRYVIQREANKTGQTTIETGDNFIYRAITGARGRQSIDSSCVCWLACARRCVLHVR